MISKPSSSEAQYTNRNTYNYFWPDKTIDRMLLSIIFNLGSYKIADPLLLFYINKFHFRREDGRFLSVFPCILTFLTLICILYFRTTCRYLQVMCIHKAFQCNRFLLAYLTFPVNLILFFLVSQEEVRHATTADERGHRVLWLCPRYPSVWSSDGAVVTRNERDWPQTLLWYQ